MEIFSERKALISIPEASAVAYPGSELLDLLMIRTFKNTFLQIYNYPMEAGSQILDFQTHFG
jgi:hypothetical protein